MQIIYIILRKHVDTISILFLFALLVSNVIFTIKSYYINNTILLIIYIISSLLSLCLIILKIKYEYCKKQIYDQHDFLLNNDYDEVTL